MPRVCYLESTRVKAQATGSNWGLLLRETAPFCSGIDTWFESVADTVQGDIEDLATQVFLGIAALPASEPVVRSESGGGPMVPQPAG